MADDDRPQYQHGTGTIGGQTFHWGSGMPGRYWSIPYGDYPVTPDAPTGAWAQNAGAIPISNNVIPDPLLGRNRIGIMIHSGSAPDLDTLYTQGCFKVAPSEWPGVRQEILAEAKSGPLYLHVAPGGQAAFTNTPTLTQASDKTPASNANAAANTTASAPVPGALSASAAPPPNPFIESLAQIESGNQNIYSKVDKDVAGPNTRSQGYFQINTPTWQDFAPKANVDLSQYPNAMSAPREVQAQVAAAIPFSRFGDRTQNMLTQQFASLDPKATIGDNATKFSDPNTVASAAPAATPTSGATVASNAAPADQSWASQAWSKLTGSPTDAQGNPTGGSSPLQQLTQASVAKLGKEGQTEAEEAPSKAAAAMMSQAPGARNVSPGLANVSQTYGTTLNSFSQPLTWGSTPLQGAGMPAAGLQRVAGAPVPGTTLNSLLTVPGFDPNLGYGSSGVGYG